ncbi:hypothetical protein [Desulfatirhabdium butyrativorans]|uniref:hypothetical protein n=1 Tax=Desulfatirhabdium butyrativorans TaxID=340467 RepID=UPI00040624FD|nr:hypothetical protein [Desulfatirhabdium butyrativorans]
MVHIRFSLFLTVLLTLLFSHTVRAQADLRTHLSPRAITANSLKASMTENEIQVSTWTYGTVDVACLVCNGYLPSGYGNNAGALYLSVVDQYPAQNGSVINAPKDMKLKANDAVVIIGKTPPPMAYFSYTGFVFDRYNADDPNNRLVIFSSLGDTINQYRVHAADPRNPFNQDIVIILTADQKTDATIRYALVEMGIDPSIINTYIIPSSVAKMGKTEEADTFVFLQRVFLPENKAEFDSYLNTASQWAQVFYLSFPDQSSLRPFLMPEMKIRGTGKTEVDMMPALDRLESTILANHPGYQAKKLETGIWLNEWLDGFQRGVNLLGECRDTTYLRTPDFSLDSDSFLMVFGVNHEATGKATYSNFSVYQAEMELGIAGKNSREFADSADGYDLGQYNSLTRYLYAYKIARNCNNETNCLPVNTVPTTASCPFSNGCPFVDLKGDLFLGFRAYVEPETGVGPYWYEILWDRAILFTPKQ